MRTDCTSGVHECYGGAEALCQQHRTGDQRHRRRDDDCRRDECETPDLRRIPSRNGPADRSVAKPDGDRDAEEDVLASEVRCEVRAQGDEYDESQHRRHVRPWWAFPQRAVSRAIASTRRSLRARVPPLGLLPSAREVAEPERCALGEAESGGNDPARSLRGDGVVPAILLLRGHGTLRPPYCDGRPDRPRVVAPLEVVRRLKMSRLPARREARWQSVCTRARPTRGRCGSLLSASLSDVYRQ